MMSIAQQYINWSNYDFNCASNSIGGLFDALINYKTGDYYNPDDAFYMANKAGILDFHVNQEKHDINNLSITQLTMTDLISE